MDITHYGHSALLIDYPGARILIDPGTFSHPLLREVEGIDAILVSHRHPDHVDPELLAALMQKNPDAAVYMEPLAAKALAEGVESNGARVTSLAPGSRIEVAGVSVLAVGGAHAVIHPDIPAVGNICLILEKAGEKTLAHTGDSLVPHPELIGIDAISFPLVAPWSKMQETIDFLRITHPRVALPVHDAVASPEGRGIYITQATAHAPDGTEVRDWPRGNKPVTLTLY